MTRARSEHGRERPEQLLVVTSIVDPADAKANVHRLYAQRCCYAVAVARFARAERERRLGLDGHVLAPLVEEPHVHVVGRRLPVVDDLEAEAAGGDAGARSFRPDYEYGAFSRFGLLALAFEPFLVALVATLGTLV